jgi:hypothetical protein
MAAAPADACYFGRDRIASVKIVKKPGVKPIGLKRGLNSRNVESRRRLQHRR